MVLSSYQSSQLSLESVIVEEKQHNPLCIPVHVIHPVLLLLVREGHGVGAGGAGEVAPRLETGNSHIQSFR